ncbi:hypothetical protein BAUCODRAFT_417421 [Baudoinia panamericana UAMH 10762]|uniref:F-box domain-containing protein n=1 Tax=Baudoinia panamericana (strain UAMH 10762) TaxID=717646 RepID=M2N2R1_BAUPA|nr:uncharacterized protein BAUCODRAFT_417421 [Baudoinia panamericana UAMH 10762]EMC98233.1 hypothetical protein BAUCODRAFT_417421 [Baudoinia panamericana UAMH 10762]
MAPSTLTDLPLELLDHITSYLPTAQSLASFSQTSKSLNAFVEKDAWQTFLRSRFPSTCPASTPSPKHTARTLTILSKAWNHRAFLARYIEPRGDIRAFPGGRKVERWKPPKGQTIGFTPHLDAYESIGPRWQDRKEVLAFSAGAEVCLQTRVRRGDQEYARWYTYRPLSAYEGRDDVTTLHLLRPELGEASQGPERVITGTANGGLAIVALPESDQSTAALSHFVTQGHPVRSSSILQQPLGKTLLVANMSDSRVCIYPVDAAQSKIAPLDSIDIKPSTSENGQRAKHQRVWSTSFLSSARIAAGIGPSDEPIHIYSLTPSGLEKEPFRKFSLQNDFERLVGEITLSGFAKKSSSSIYPILPLPPSSSSGGSSDGDVFLTGAYDGIIRLHDLRSDRQVERTYTDPTDDSAIYSLLARGQEKLIAGSSRHSLLKVFDMRMGADCYSYLDASTCHLPSSGARREPARDWNLFLRPHSATHTGRGGGNNWARRSHESSVYSLASPSSQSPYLYAGVENAILELAFTSILDQQPDPTFFSTWKPVARGKTDAWRSAEVLDLAMYDQTADMKLYTQRSLWSTWNLKHGHASHASTSLVIDGLDERWRLGTEGA